jgi:predicted AlkP superfamily pyrophosphatase or phosphodiesterase
MPPDDGASVLSAGAWFVHPTLVLLVVGLTPNHLGENAPRLAALAATGGMRPLRTVTPAVTCTVQATFMTGVPPAEHGIVANGWLFRDLMEVMFWRQSNRLVAGEKIWEAGRRRDPAFTCANLFWWFNMAAAHDFGVTPRPIYKADGRKLADCYTVPAELRDELTRRYGPFPLFQFWGPGTSIASSRWIVDAALHVLAHHSPTLTLVYLPHLDYDLQRFGPDDTHPKVAASLRAIDAEAGRLIDAAARTGRRVIVLSEYGIVPVSRPILINRALREAGFLKVRNEDGGEILDPVASRAFAVCDHQIAHVYVAEPNIVTPVRQVLEAVPGVERVFGAERRGEIELDHPRSGELVALAEREAWFAYPYWRDDRHAPDFARTVEIHRKPGYDPAELFFDPAIRLPDFAVARRLIARKLGFRSLMDVVPLDPTLVKGSHGRSDLPYPTGPLLISSEARLLPDGPVAATDVKALVLGHVFSRAAAGTVMT